MTKTQYKKLIQSLSREELEAHLLNMFTSSKAFMDIESSFWSPESNEDLLSSFQKKLERTFWKNQFSLSECKEVLKDFTSRCVHPPTIALMNLYFAMEAAQLSATYGDFGSAFYNAMVRAAEKYLDYARTDKEFFDSHKEEFEKMIRMSDMFGYGVDADLENMYDYAKETVYWE